MASVRRGVLSLVWLGAFSFALPVSAEPKVESNFRARPTAIYAELGLGAPLGWAGVEIEQTLASFLAMSGGVGMGFAGPQIAAMPRFRVGGRQSVATIGMGVSYGKFHWSDRCSLDCTPEIRDGTVAWGNLEGGYELRRSNGFSLRAFAGYGRIITGQLGCTAVGTFGCGIEDGRSLAYVGVAVGWAF